MEHIQSKSRRSLEPQCDIISDLPRDVLYRIMVRLPLRDAARMSVLSHKWQDIWTSIPHLAFDSPFFKNVLKKDLSEPRNYCSIVSKILLQHEGPILKFLLHVPNLKSAPDVSQWIPHLSRNGLRDFSLCNESRMHLGLSSRLFSSCGGLEKLKLTGCKFSLPPNFRGFPKLKSLELDRMSSSFRYFNDLISSCSALQNLALTQCTGMESNHVVVDAPNLRSLALDSAFGSLVVKSCDNLVTASISMHASPNVRHKASLLDLVKAVANSSKLERLCLGFYSYIILFEKCSIRNTFEKPRILELPDIYLNNVDDLSSVLSCIQSFPNIEMLKIWVSSSVHFDEHVFDKNPDFTLNHLRCAKIGIRNASKIELKLIEALLACSPVLEKLSVLPTVSLNQSSHGKMLVQLNRLRRVSQKVEVIYPESVFLPEPSVPSESSSHESLSPSSSGDSQSSENSWSSDSSS